MSNQKSGCFAGMLGVLLVLSVILNVSFFASKSGKIQSAVKMGPHFPDFEERVVEVPVAEASGSDRRIALIELSGVIGAEDGGDIDGVGYENLVQQLRRAGVVCWPVARQLERVLACVRRHAGCCRDARFQPPHGVVEEALQRRQEAEAVLGRCAGASVQPRVRLGAGQGDERVHVFIG
jgi:hypothetical protein